MNKLVLVLAGAALFGAACVEKEKEERPDDGFIAQNLLGAPPAPQHVVNADLGGKVIYLGCDVDHETAQLGDKVKITHYWKVVEAPGPDWKLFTHVNGPSGDWINVDETRMRKQYGPDRWKVGDLVRDEQVFPILNRWKSNVAIVYVGMYRKGGQGERDRMPVKSGPTDGKNRIEVVKIPIGGAVAPAASKTALPFYVVRRATGPITIDGKGSEPDWDKAGSTGSFRTAEGGTDPGGSASARLLWDDKNLYILADVADKDVASSYRKHDDPIWKEDALEVFLDADKSGKGYVELQVSPRNVTFDTWYPTVRPEGKVAWESQMVTAVTVDGTLDRRDDVDRGWRAELAIPLAAVKGEDGKMDVRLPPRVGDTWKMDLVRVEKPKDGALTASAWASISIADFHALDRLVTVTFGDEQGGTAPPAEARPDDRAADPAGAGKDKKDAKDAKDAKGAKAGAEKAKPAKPAAAKPGAAAKDGKVTPPR